MLPIVFGAPSEEQWPFPGRQAGGCCDSPFEVNGLSQQMDGKVLGDVDGSFSECLFAKGGLFVTVPLV